jgi:hypothetical protein
MLRSMFLPRRLNIIVQYFILLVGVTTSKHVEWYSCCLCGHCFSPVFKLAEWSDAACVAIALALCLTMLSDTDAACVATALALCLKKKRNRRWTKDWYKRRPQYTHENLMTDWILSEPND